MSRADARAEIARSKRIVVKIGSSSLGQPEASVRLARSIASATKGGRRIVVVSSGAIAFGAKKLGYRGRPRELAKLQAAAAAGQSLLMRAYEDAFAAHGLSVAQVLVTHADFADRRRANNARAALFELVQVGAIPILNENDSVSTEEIKFGDNDELSAMIAPLVDADLLVLLSDIDGLLDAKQKRVPVVNDIEKEARSLVTMKKSDVGTGGMQSKLEAARRATLSGAHVVIANAKEDDVLARICAGEDIGTLFVPPSKRLRAKHHWIAFTLRPRGDLILDAGAEAALHQGKSLLSVGVRSLRGDFHEGDAVRVISRGGDEIGRGLVRVDAARALGIVGRPSEEVDPVVIIHRDELVVW